MIPHHRCHSAPQLASPPGQRAIGRRPPVGWQLARATLAVWLFHGVIRGIRPPIYNRKIPPMNNIQSPVTRRTLAKGAAWAVPAVGLMAAAPAFAASPPTTITCPDPAGISLQGGSVLSMTTRAIGDGTYAGGTYFGLNLGQWNVPAAVGNNSTEVTGYYLLTGQCGIKTCDANYIPGTEFTVTNGNGVAYKGKVTAQSPVACSPQVAGAGLSESIHLQTSIPYYSGADSCQVFSNAAKAGALGCFSMPVTIIYLNGTTPVYTSGGGSCCVYMNVCFDTTGCIGTEGTTSLSFSSSPLY